ncbi:MAG: 16S rRNA (guanine(966)-N(2))-methyltransferase RsmD [Erysipelotrichaceae bacterium]|nr:16S rRNA (guanine(966)-N(2))-methyltransferase RsmD [Erysipelotrichaceae bacterium]
MRIVAGRYKRTPLVTLEGEATRPTRDMVREALFSSVDVEGMDVLDLFSGSGAIGIEALSRGAADAVFNDVNPAAAKIIRTNLEKVHEKRTVYELGYDLCLKRLEGRAFDFIFLDPPYAFQDFEGLFALLERYGNVKEGSLIIAEVRKDHVMPEEYGSFKSYKEKKYGITRLVYYRYHQ